MSFLFHMRNFILILIVSLGVNRALATTAFRICSEPNNLPMSYQSDQTGYEIEVARLLAKELQRPLEVKWVSQRDPSYFRSTIGADVCDAIMGVPMDFAKLTTSHAWYRTGYVFVTRADSQVSLTSFDDRSFQHFSVAVPATGMGETPPSIALTNRSLQEHLRPFSISEPAAMITAVVDHQVDVSIMWGPFATWFSNLQKTPLMIVATPEQDGNVPLSFDISVGVKKGNILLRDEINQVLDRNQKVIKSILQKWNVPLHDQI